MTSRTRTPQGLLAPVWPRKQPATYNWDYAKPAHLWRFCTSCKRDVRWSGGKKVAGWQCPECRGKAA